MIGSLLSVISNLICGQFVRIIFGYLFSIYLDGILDAEYREQSTDYRQTGSRLSHLCVQIRLVCSAGASPAGEKVRAP